MMRSVCATILGLIFTSSFAGPGLRVEIGQTRNNTEANQVVAATLRNFGTRAVANAYPWAYGVQQRTGRTPFITIPTRVTLTNNGNPLPPAPPPGRAPGDLTLVFNTTGPNAFPTNYRTHLQQTFTLVKPVLDSLFGQAALSGNVKVLNFDATIGDRSAVAGGAYVHNAPGGPEIHFPVYNNLTGASINFMHVLLLAYQGPNVQPFDVWSEGLVRATVIRAARTPSTIPGSPPLDEIEGVLESSYDVGPFYDWYNQTTLGARSFIAPNLLNQPLPVGGSTGGIFLLRYQMAGTAFAKIAAQYPGFIAEFNRLYNASPAAYQTNSDLVDLGQRVLNSLLGAPNGTVEDLSFSDWADRQGIFDVSTRGGTKVLVQPIPFLATAGSDDFGVFGIVANVFRVDALGNETLLSGKSYPIFWREDYTRFFAAAQDDVIDIAGAYGSVVPNFTNTGNGFPYRVTVDVPFGGQLARTVLPAGSYSTGTSPLPKEVFGTISGIDPAATNVSVRLTAPLLTAPVNMQVQRFAFGADIADDQFLQPQSCLVEVFQGANLLFSRRVNKTNGPLALDLHPPTSYFDGTFTVPKGLAFFGPGAMPLRGEASAFLAETPATTLVARWNSILGKFDMYPTEGAFEGGLGYFVQSESAAIVNNSVKRVPRTPISVALQPGWNSITNPINESIALTALTVTTKTEAVRTYNEAIGTVLGSTAFRFSQSPGNVDTGTFSSLTVLAPGQSIYIRCDVADGAVLIFSPTDSRQQGRGREGGSTPSLTPDWEMKATLYRGKTVLADAFFGQSQRASDAFDRRFDSGLPPSAGGVQLMFSGTTMLYRDIRLSSRATTFRLNVTNLTPGTEYTLNLGRHGRMVPVTLVDLRTGRQYIWRFGGNLRFVPTTANIQFDIRVGVNR